MSMDKDKISSHRIICMFVLSSVNFRAVCAYNLINKLTKLKSTTKIIKIKYYLALAIIYKISRLFFIIFSLYYSQSQSPFPLLELCLHPVEAQSRLVKIE